MEIIMQLKTQFKYSALFAAVTFSIASHAATVNINNPGFEDSFDSWETKDPSAISSDERSGSKAAKITGQGGKFVQDVSVEKNTDYELSAYIDGDGKIGVTIDGERTRLTGGGDDEYEKVTVSFNSGDESTISIWGEYNDGTARFDDFTLTSTEADTADETDSNEDTANDDSAVEPGTATYPSDLFNYEQWKITYPDGEEVKQLYQEENEYFYVNDDQNGIVFFAPIRSDNGTTENSDNIRSELRERTADGDSDIYWTTDGTHVIYVKQAITHLPIVNPYLVATQIHGDKEDGIDDAMVLRLEEKHLFLSFNGGKLHDDVTVKTDYELGTVHEVIFEVIDGKHYVYYSEDGQLESAYNAGNASKYLVKDGSNDYVMDLDYDKSYFKAGNYTQSNADKEGDETDNPDNYGEVVLYDVWVDHDE